MKFFSEKRRHWSERLFWILSFAVSIVGCSILVHRAYSKWQLNPVIVSFAERPTAAWQLPFPAVTFCPTTKALRKHLNLTKCVNAVNNYEEGNLTNDELRAFEAVSQICPLPLKKKKSLKPHEIVPLIRSVSVGLNTSTIYCRWKSEGRYCKDYFTEILTEEGFCYTFNLLSSSDIFKADA